MGWTGVESRGRRKERRVRYRECGGMIAERGFEEEGGKSGKPKVGRTEEVEAKQQREKKKSKK